MLCLYRTSKVQSGAFEFHQAIANRQIEAIYFAPLPDYLLVALLVLHPQVSTRVRPNCYDQTAADVVLVDMRGARQEARPPLMP